MALRWAARQVRQASLARPPAAAGRGAGPGGTLTGRWVPRRAEAPVSSDGRARARRMPRASRASSAPPPIGPSPAACERPEPAAGTPSAEAGSRGPVRRPREPRSPAESRRASRSPDPERSAGPPDEGLSSMDDPSATRWTRRPCAVGTRAVRKSPPGPSRTSGGVARGAAPAVTEGPGDTGVRGIGGNPLGASRAGGGPRVDGVEPGAARVRPDAIGQAVRETLAEQSPVCQPEPARRPGGAGLGCTPRCRRARIAGCRRRSSPS